MTPRRRTKATVGTGARARAGAASGLALASGLGMPAVARGGPSLEPTGRDWELRGDIGLFVAFHFGDARGGDVGLGLEAHGVYVDAAHDCGGTQQLFVGAVGRVEVIDFKRVRLTAGPAFGRTNGLLGFGGELTGGMGFGPDRGPIVQASAEAVGFFLLNARVGYTVARDWQMGLGLRFPPISYSGGCAVGRPVRRDESRAPVQGAEAAGPPGAVPASPDRARGSAIWMRRACLEWASVPAFVELAEQLTVCGAPPPLVARARAAAVEELGHAITSVETARTLGGLTGVSLDPPLLEQRPAIGVVQGLRRLVLESWQDGCVGERASALIAAREQDTATDPAIARVQSRIAREENGHAELAWDIVEWALAVNRSVVAPLLAVSAAARPSIPTPDENGPATSGDGLAEWGILGSAAARSLQADAHADARARLAARLGA